METQQKAGQNLIRVRPSSLVLTVGNEEISLPRLGYIPRNDDILHVYNAEGETGYSFENAKGELQALYTQSADGNMIFKRAGQDELHISKESLAEMRKNDIGSWQKDFDLDNDRPVVEYTSYPSGKQIAKGVAVGLTPLLAGEGTFPLMALMTGAGMYIQRKYKENKPEQKVSISQINDLRTVKGR